MRSASALAALVVLFSCGVPSTREVQGQLAGMSVEQALVFSETPDRQVAVAGVTARGAFVVEVPVDTPTRLVIARATADGTVVVAERHIGPSWFTVPAGGRLDLGVVRPAGVERPAVEPVDNAGHTCPGATTTPTTPIVPTTPGRADLPYDAKLSVGDTFKLTDAFLEKGPLPAQVVSVTMDGTPWRLTELRNDTPFTVTQADCDHAGNRDTGRDRIIVTWKNADGSQESDHLDMRYCESGSSTSLLSDGSSGEVDGVESHDGVCAPVEVEGCGEDKADCDHEDALTPVQSGGVCGGSPAPGGATEIGSGGAGAPIN